MARATEEHGWIRRRTGHVPLADTFSHTAYGAFWPNHEWLSQVVLYGVYAVGGLPLLTIVSAGVVTTAWAIVWMLTSGSKRTRFLLIVAVYVERTGDFDSLFRQYDIHCAYVAAQSPVSKRLVDYLWTPLYRDDSIAVLSSR